MKELNPSLSIVTWYMTVAYAPCCFLSSHNLQNKEVDYIYIFLLRNKRNCWKNVFWRGLVLQYEWYFDEQISHFINIIGRNVCTVLSWNTAGVHYKLQVDNVISVAVHNNKLWHCIITENTNSVLDYLH